MIYICGDSFGVPDPGYGSMWADYLGKDYPVRNLAQVCASNLMISAQVDTAIADKASYIILLCTASTRSETRIDGRVVPYSIHSLDSTTPFDSAQLEILRLHTAEFHDMDLEIYRNSCIIQAMLSRLVLSGIPFVFDQGGFEHHSYGGVGRYFGEYAQYKSRYCLWDYDSVRSYRPYYHIKDDSVHRLVADYYRGLINEQA